MLSVISSSFLVSKEIHTVTFACTYPSLYSSHNNPFLTHPALCPLLNFKPIKYSWCCPRILACVIFHWNMVDFPGATPERKPTVSFSKVISCQYFLSLGYDVMPNSPCCDFFYVLSLHSPCAWGVCFCAFTCINALLCLENAVSLWSSFVLKFFSVFSSTKISEPWETVMWHRYSF